ncbi:MAG: NPCBM/NEW2 domain-containing protein [Gammaproteobacteria bacterium]|nr:NPCBM/NEW2 domain-containing protein [Gammaproteobacteria bacterium]MCP5195495.1 NPCBM/NEW2 domain-containing protein [Gammaproteobacteria bacterium]
MEKRIGNVPNELEISARDFAELLAIAEESHSAGRLSPIEVGYLLQRAQAVLANYPTQGSEIQPPIDPQDFAQSSIRARRCQIHTLRVNGYQHLRQQDSGWRLGIFGYRENCFTLIIVAILIIGAYFAAAIQFENWNPFSWTKWTLGPVRVHNFDQRWSSIALIRTTEREGIQIESKSYAIGIRVQAPSHIEIEVIASGDHFSGRCGLPDQAIHGQILCRIFAGEQLLFESDLLASGHRLVDFSVIIPPDRRLILAVQSATTSLRDADGAWVNLHVD